MIYSEYVLGNITGKIVSRLGIYSEYIISEYTLGALSHGSQGPLSLVSALYGTHVRSPTAQGGPRILTIVLS